MKQYLDLLRDVLENGKVRTNRTGVDTLGVFGRQARYSLKEGLPIVTTKKVSFHNIVVELLWFLSGSTDVKYLQERNVHIWDEWANKEGELVNCYGKQWRFYEAIDKDRPFVQESATDFTSGYPIKTIDQIARVIDRIKKFPDCRRLIVSAWNPGDLEEASLAWCHSQFQFYVQDGELSCHLLQRSGDIFLGIPYNITSYCLLTCMIAQVCGLQPGEFVHSITDLHLYTNHLEQAKLQLTREPLPLPKLWLDSSIKDIDDFRYEHIKLLDYKSHPAISAPVAV